MIYFPSNIIRYLGSRRNSKYLSKFRNIFSVTGAWDPELNDDIKKEIEIRWRERINIPCPDEDKNEKFYLLSMFPYPSGYLHMGHVRVYTISDALARFYRMHGKQVIHPIGWDAFGLPAENAAISKNIHPAEWTMKNIAAMKQQLKLLNISFNWNMELSTCDPVYYKWTQYLFLLLYKNGLAYKKMAQVNWDPVDQTVLADEQVDENGCSWRSGSKVEKKMLTQWFLQTTAFAKELYDGLSDPCLREWRDVIKIQQNWIGECNGFTFHLKLFNDGVELENTLPVWTDRPEYIFGASFVALSVEHLLNTAEFGGGYSSGTHVLSVEVVHPLTGSMLSVFVSDEFTFPEATSSRFGIPTAEDEVSFGFALRNELDMIPVSDSHSNRVINSEEFSGMLLDEARIRIIERAQNSGIKVHPASKKLRDWLISRQRYWGTPIPVINCPSCKIVPVPLEDLPVVLPNIEFKGKTSSLVCANEWLHVKCPRCGEEAMRETDTMDTFVDSSWYFLRYLDVSNSSKPFDSEKIKEFMPVDLYVGGKEHATMHLFYARFLSHFCHSIGLLNQPEPFHQLLMQGMIQGQSYQIKSTGKYIPKDEVDLSVVPPVEKTSQSPVVVNWEKMSKSKYNGVDPEHVINQHGIDTTRLFILGSVAPQSPRKWNEDLFPGIWNWQRRIWLTVSDFLALKRNEVEKIPLLKDEEVQTHEARLISAKNYYIKRATHSFRNTNQISVVIAKLQGLTGDLRGIPKYVAKDSKVYEETLAALLIMLAPLAPHFASELWAGFCSVASLSDKYDLTKPVLYQKWPVRDNHCQFAEIDIRMNGNAIHTIMIPYVEIETLTKQRAVKLAKNEEIVQKELENVEVQAVEFQKWFTNDADVNFVLKVSEKKKAASKVRKKKKAVSAEL